MSREIRRVPPGWEHPRKDDGEGAYIPLYDKAFDDVMAKWIADATAWVAQVQAGETPDPWKWYAETEDEAAWARANPLKAYAEWDNSPPDPQSYRDVFTTEPTAWQIYETVSEGTPISPVFTTEAEMITWMMQNHPYDEPDMQRYGLKWQKMTEAGAKRFIAAGSVPSMFFSPETGLLSGTEWVDRLADDTRRHDG